jgi:hypothetical protein
MKQVCMPVGMLIPCIITVNLFLLSSITSTHV